MNTKDLPTCLRRYCFRPDWAEASRSLTEKQVREMVRHVAVCRAAVLAAYLLCLVPVIPYLQTGAWPEMTSPVSLGTTMASVVVCGVWFLAWRRVAAKVG